MKGILGVSDEPLVSMDFKGDSRCSIIDADSTMVLGGTWSRSSPGTTTSGATAAASPTSSRSSRPGCLTRPDRPPATSRAPSGATMDKLTVRDVDVAGQARLRARRLQRPARGRQGHRRLAHPRRAADDPLPPRARRDGRSSRATSAGPTARSPDSLRLRPVGAAPAAAPAAATCPVTGDALGRRHRGRRQAAPARRGAAAREPALPRRGGATTRSSRSTLASYADVYVNDAFGTAHRAHASTVGVAQAPAGLRRAA